MSASWYDVLGVPSEASAEEIRTAWKDSIADLDPTDRRFGLYNEAAGVLLDEQKRSAYDAELATADKPDASEEATESESERVERAPESESETPTSVITETSARRSRTERSGTGRSGAPAWARHVPDWLLAVLLVATLAAAGTAYWLHRDAGVDPDDVEDQITAARTAAEDSVPKVLTYDYRYPERDHDRAMAGLSDKFGEDYEQIWNDAILPNLKKAKASAQSQVLGSGVVRASEDGDRVELVVVVSSRTSNRNVSTQIPPLPMTVRMVNSHGDWLIEKMDLWEPESQAGEGSDEPGSGDRPSKQSGNGTGGKSGSN